MLEKLSLQKFWIQYVITLHTELPSKASASITLQMCTIFDPQTKNATKHCMGTRHSLQRKGVVTVGTLPLDSLSLSQTAPLRSCQPDRPVKRPVWNGYPILHNRISLYIKTHYILLCPQQAECMKLGTMEWIQTFHSYYKLTLSSQGDLFFLFPQLWPLYMGCAI